MKLKKYIFILLVLFVNLIVFNSHTVYGADETTKIVLSDEMDSNIVNIGAAGTYEISGSSKNAQISINASDTDEIIIILNGADITYETAPAIIVYNAKDEQIEGQANVKFILADGSENKVTGGSTSDYDGAISSDISISFEGNGKLIIDSSNEGIETKRHVTFNSGNYEIYSNDDAINGSEDNISCITINGGTILASIKDTAVEGDGIDSNGSLYINGGTVYAFASEKSEDAGVDATLRCVYKWWNTNCNRQYAK
ncbi:MAG: carbohydrate-binding domain-containing protein [Lachnospiraceae bacterium]|jgi:hypothetical protein|nr:carbohydrate-binding domain-containing protein [Lachnospiraceae bacterium]